MMLWIASLIGLAIGAVCGGYRALRMARQGDLPGATRSLRSACFAAAIAGTALTIPVMGWPWKEKSATVPETVHRTVEETIEVPVQVTRWIFFKRTTTESRQVTKEITETKYRSEMHTEFSAWLLIPMAFVGLACFYFEKWLVQLCWRIFV